MPLKRRIGVCSWSLAAESPEALIDVLGRVRISAVQLALTPLVAAPRVWADAPARLAAAGVGILSGMLAFPSEDYSTLESIRRTGGVRPDEHWPANRALSASVAQAAGDAGIGLVTFHAGFLAERRDDPTRRVMIERLGEIADRFAERGVSIALETGQERAGTLPAVLADLGRPGVGVNFDPANMILYGMGDPVEAIRELAPWVRQVHVKDALPARAPGTWGTEVPAGQGAVDWEGLFETALGLDPPVPYVIEREAGTRHEPDVVAARELIERHAARRVVR